MNIETLLAYPKLHFGPRRTNGTLGVKLIVFPRVESQGNEGEEQAFVGFETLDVMDA